MIEGMRFQWFQSPQALMQAPLSYSERAVITTLLADVERRIDRVCSESASLKLLQSISTPSSIRITQSSGVAAGEDVQVMKCQMFIGDFYLTSKRNDRETFLSSPRSLELLFKTLFPMLPAGVRCQMVEPLERRSEVTVPLEVSVVAANVSVELGLSREILQRLTHLSAEMCDSILLSRLPFAETAVRIGIDINWPLRNFLEAGNQHCPCSQVGFIELLPFGERQYCVAKVSREAVCFEIVGGRNEIEDTAHKSDRRSILRWWMAAPKLQNNNNQKFCQVEKKMNEVSIFQNNTASALETRVSSDVSLKPHSLLAAEISVQVELGELHLTVQELLNLRPGTKFKVDLPPDTQFPLRVGGEEVGTACLASEGNQTVLVVTELLNCSV